MTTKKIRRAQTISPFGVGAILDLNGEGFVVESIDRWGSRLRKSVYLPRLTRALGNIDLVSFSDAGSSQGNDAESLKVSRFPRWYHCASCRKLQYIDHNLDAALGDDPPHCTNSACKRGFTSPMRFIAYCDDGHMSDIDWFAWCHRGKDATKGRCEDRTRLYFRSSGKMGGDFSEMRIVCEECGRSEDLTDIQRGTAAPWMLKDRPITAAGKCCGKQPWQFSGDAVECNNSMNIEDDKMS